MNFQILIGVFFESLCFSHLHVWERTFLDNLKHWISIYQPHLSPPLLQSVVPDCGCKDKPIISPFPNFFTHFLKVFSINRDRTFLIRHLEQWFFYAIFLSYSSLQNKSRLKEGGGDSLFTRFSEIIQDKKRKRCKHSAILVEKR